MHMYMHTHVHISIYRGAYMGNHAYSLVIGRKSTETMHIPILSDGNRGSSKNPNIPKEGKTVGVLKGNPKKGTAVKN